MKPQRKIVGHVATEGTVYAVIGYDTAPIEFSMIPVLWFEIVEVSLGDEVQWVDRVGIIPTVDGPREVGESQGFVGYTISSHIDNIEPWIERFRNKQALIQAGNPGALPYH